MNKPGVKFNCFVGADLWSPIEYPAEPGGTGKAPHLKMTAEKNLKMQVTTWLRNHPNAKLTEDGFEFKSYPDLKQGRGLIHVLAFFYTEPEPGSTNVVASSMTIEEQKEKHGGMSIDPGFEHKEPI